MKLMRKINHAFTLLELVVAISLMGMVALIIGTASATFYSGYERITGMGAQLKEFQAVDGIMDNLIRNMIPFSWTNPESDEEALVFAGGPEEIFFVSRRRSYTAEAGALIFMRLKLEDDSLLAEYSFMPRGPWDTQSTSQLPFSREVIARNVERILFRYPAASEDKVITFSEDWDENDLNIPMAVQLEIWWKNGTKEVWLRRTAGASSNSTLWDKLYESTE